MKREMPNKPRVAIIGCGSISHAYLKNAKELYADAFELVAVSDVRGEQARAVASVYGVQKVLTTEQLLQDEEIDLAINLTVPKAHCALTIALLEAGKHVYTEKPLGLSPEEADAIRDAEERTGCRVGCAPDTFLGMPVQTAIKAIHSDYIGQIFGASCLCIHPTHGNENWHPEPEFYYKKGAGPMFDMAAYYFYALIAMMGPIKSVACYQTLNFPERTIATMPHKGEKIVVEVPTHVVGLYEFQSGAVGTIMNTLDVWNSKQPWMEIYGTKGSLILPDPNQFTGDVLLTRLGYGEEAWEKVPDLVEYKKTQRGQGVVDMIGAIRQNRPIRASAEMGRHVVEIVNAFDEAARTRRTVELTTTCTPPLPRFMEGGNR